MKFELTAKIVKLKRISSDWAEIILNPDKTTPTSLLISREQFDKNKEILLNIKDNIEYHFFGYIMKNKFNEWIFIVRGVIEAIPTEIPEQDMNQLVNNFFDKEEE